MLNTRRRMSKISSFLALAIFAIFATLLVNANQASAYTLSKTMPDSDFTNWSLDGTGNTDIILFPTRMGLTDASWIATGTERSYIKYKEQTGNYTIGDSAENSGCGSIGYMKNFGTSASPDAKIVLRFERAARGISGTYYDVYMTITGITFQSTEASTYGAAILYGCGGNMEYNGFRYGSVGGSLGLKATIEVRLYQNPSSMAYNSSNDTVTITGTRISKGHKMIWGFSDVDIKDYISDPGGNHHYGSGHEYAEHVKLYNTNRKYIDDTQEITKNYFYDPIYLSENTELRTVASGTYGQDILFYHYFEPNQQWNDDYGKTDLIVRVNPYYFKFQWQGSGCSTTAVSMAGTMYTGTSYIYKGDSIAETALLTWNQNTNNKSVEVNNNSQKMTFKHQIYRNDQGPTTDNEEYYVKAEADSGPSYGSSSATKSYSSPKDHPQIVYTQNAPSGNPFTVNLTPGQEKIVAQTLYYQISNVHKSLFNYVDMECKLTSPHLVGTACVKLWRPVAKFSGNVNGKSSPMAETLI